MIKIQIANSNRAKSLCTFNLGRLSTVMHTGLHDDGENALLPKMRSADGQEIHGVKAECFSPEKYGS
jgi:hypothetical protein